MLNKIIKSIVHFFTHDPNQEFEEKYLSQASDIYDLEHRMKYLERRRAKNLYKNYY